MPRVQPQYPSDTESGYSGHSGYSWGSDVQSEGPSDSGAGSGQQGESYHHHHLPSWVYPHLFRHHLPRWPDEPQYHHGHWQTIEG